MSELKDNLYDIKEAIALSQQLIGAASASVDKRESPYIRFSAGSRFSPQAQHPEPTRPTDEGDAEQTPPLPTDPFRNGEEMVRWCIEAAGGTFGFVIDGQGFVILREGEDPDDSVEGVAANMGMVIGQLNQMEIEKGDIQVADLIYQNGFMLIICVKDKEGDPYSLGIVGDTPITTATKKVIYQQVRRSLMQLVL